MNLNPQDIADWDMALNAAQHHVNLQPVRDRENLASTPNGSSSIGSGSSSNSNMNSPHDDGSRAALVAASGPADGGGSGGRVEVAGDEASRPMYNGTMPLKKKPGRKPKVCADSYDVLCFPFDVCVSM